MRIFRSPVKVSHNILKAMAMTGTRTPTPLNRMGTLICTSLYLPRSRADNTSRILISLETRFRVLRTSRFPSRTGLTRKTLHSLRETHMLVSPSQQHRQRQTLSLKLSRMFGAASLMSLRANRATHIKDCRTANLGDGLSL